MWGLKVGTAEIVVLRDVIPCSLIEKYQDIIISHKNQNQFLIHQTKNILEDSEVYRM
jgi:hypothetical protein